MQNKSLFIFISEMQSTFGECQRYYFFLMFNV